MTAAADDYRRTVAEAERFVRVGEGHYRLDAAEARVVFDLDRCRRESRALWCELVVRTDIPGARTYDGVLHAGDLNLSSTRALQERGKHLAARARLEEEGVDFVGLLEEAAMRIIADERKGSPAVVLRDIPRPKLDSDLVVDGFPLVTQQSNCIFGMGGDGKSATARHLGIELGRLGKRVAIADWELEEAYARDGLERECGPDGMTDLRYVRCERPLIFEGDRLRRIVREEGIEFLILDSVAFAAHDAPENAATAAAYFQALRTLGPITTIHVAHVSKSEGADKAPFGSVLWHNGFRSTWFCKRAEAESDGGRLTIALYNRKANFSSLRPAIGYEITFGEERTSWRRVSVADSPDLAMGLSVKQRIAHAVRGGAMTIAEIARDLEVKADTVEKTVKRSAGKVFTFVPGADGTRRVGLLGRSA